MTKGLFVNLITTGKSPLSSRIKEIITVDLHAGSDFDVLQHPVSSLEEERLALTDLCLQLAGSPLIYNDPMVPDYLAECCREYHLDFCPSDIISLCDCLEELKAMGLDTGGLMERIPRYTGTLKHFYKDYKNYYYLPAEDQAYHKSVSEFVDRGAREKATPRTAYTKKTGTFVPVYDVSLVDPNALFQKEYGHGAFYTLPQYLDLNNAQVLSSYMFRPRRPEDA